MEPHRRASDLVEVGFLRGLFLFRKLHAPLVLGDTNVVGHRLCLALLDLPTLFEELLDEVFVGGGLGDVFHLVCLSLGLLGAGLGGDCDLSVTGSEALGKWPSESIQDRTGGAPGHIMSRANADPRGGDPTLVSWRFMAAKLVLPFLLTAQVANRLPVRAGRRWHGALRA